VNDAPLAARAGAALLHSLWIGSAIACAVALVLPLVGPQRPQLRLAIAGLAMAVLLMTPAAILAIDVAPGAAWMTAATAAWAAGSATAFIRLGNSLRAVAALRRAAHPAGSHWQKQLDACRTAIGMTMPVTLLASPHCHVPCAIGVRMPVIVLPDNRLSHLSGGHWRAVITHELVHVARRDYLWHLVQVAAQALLFYQPAAYWLSSVIDREREARCDKDAARASDPLLLAESLAFLEQRTGPAPGAAGDAGGGLLARVERLVGSEGGSGARRGAWRRPAVLTVLVVSAVGLAGGPALIPTAGAMPFVAAVALGLAIGLRHAVEPDHLVAVATLVTGERSVRSAVRLGASWGAGHTLAILGAGGVLVSARRAMPDTMGVFFELAVALMILAMGARALVDALRVNQSGALTLHHHGGRPHVHMAAGDHVHVAGLALATRPLVVGLVHGLAGSGALTAVAIASLPSWPEQLVFLFVFGVGSAAGMAVVTGLAGWPLARLAGSRGMPMLSGAAGLAAIVFSLAWGAPLLARALIG
jgi:hypothetical protein